MAGPTVAQIRNRHVSPVDRNLGGVHLSVGCMSISECGIPRSERGARRKAFCICLSNLANEEEYGSNQCRDRPIPSQSKPGLPKDESARWHSRDHPQGIARFRLSGSNLSAAQDRSSRRRTPVGSLSLWD